MILVDSDILIEVTRGRDAAILELWTQASESADAILYSPVTEADVWAGARPSEHGRLAALFDALTCAEITSSIGKSAGGMLNKYAKSHGLEIADALIAASAMHYSARLWTRNRKHYPMPKLSFFTRF